MTQYELMLLTRTDLEDSARTAIVERAQQAVTSTGGTFHEVNDWGRRTTTYPIEKLADAHYQLLLFDGTGETADEAIRVLRITEGVLRAMAVRRVPAYPADAALETISDEELAAGPPQRGRGRGRGGGGGRGRDRD
jgi:small subunit ribosomal protein S6